MEILPVSLCAAFKARQSRQTDENFAITFLAPLGMWNRRLLYSLHLRLYLHLKWVYSVGFGLLQGDGRTVTACCIFPANFIEQV